METVIKNAPVFRLVKVSLVFIDPPFGWNLSEWDRPEDVWQDDHWFDLLSYISPHLKDSAAVVVFGDCFNVLPKLLNGVSDFNSYSSKQQKPTFTAPVQICFNKTNHPHKAANGYSQSVEHAFLFFYKQHAPIKKLKFELRGNLLTSSKVSGSRRILDGSGNMINPCQKPNIWLRYFLDNHTVEDSVVMDLTCGSFSSFLACYFCTHRLHWIGCDIATTTLKNWDFLISQITTESPAIEIFFEGNFI
jgi:hypothetical protein